MCPRIAALLSVAACAAALSAAVPAAETSTVTMQRTLPTRDSTHVAIVRIVTAPPPTAPSMIDRTFHPDYSHALTPDQMLRVWNAEIDRVFQTPVTGGG
jgi:hypothetical protein